MLVITLICVIFFFFPSVFRIMFYPISGETIHVVFLNISDLELSTTSIQPVATPAAAPAPRSAFRCAESVPSYNDVERTVFNVPDHMRHTCLFENLYYDMQRRRLFFLIEDENDTMGSLPPMSIMGFPNTLSAPMAFPAGTITEVKRSAFLNEATLLTFAPILGMVSRTYEVHHGHTLFDGVLSHWFAMKRMNITNAEIARRDMLIQFHDRKGLAPMDDRFRLLSSLPFLYGDHAIFQGLADLDTRYFQRIQHSDNQSNTDARTIVRIERAIFGLAGFGWASAPQTQEWRGQKMRLFRRHAFAKLNITEARSIDTNNINLLIIDRVPSTRLSNGKIVNYFARWIFDEAAAFAHLAADIPINITRVTFEDTTLEYQMRVVQSASIIMTLEGCAMENVPFFRDHTALIALQYNRRWEHYYYLSARHFVEYAQFNHVKMVSTWIDANVIPIQNTGGNYGVHLYYDLMLSAIRDAILLQNGTLDVCNGRDRCGSLISYTHDNGTFSMF